MDHYIVINPQIKPIKKMHIGPPIQKVVNKHPRMPTSHPLASFAKPFKSFPLAVSRQQNPVSGTGTMSVTKDRKSRKFPNCFQDPLSRPEKSTPEPQNCPNLLHTPSRLISACKNPRTPSLSYDRNGPGWNINRPGPFSNKKHERSSFKLRFVSVIQHRTIGTCRRVGRFIEIVS